MPRIMKVDPSSGQPKDFYSLQPWTCQHWPDHSEISAYVEASGKWETVLLAQPTSGGTAEAMANYVVSLQIQRESMRVLLKQAALVLELIISDGLTFSSEQSAERVITQIKKFVP